MRGELPIFDLRTHEGSHGVTRLLPSPRKVAAQWQDGLLALSEIRNTHSISLVQKKSRSATRKSQQFCYNPHSCIGHEPYSAGRNTLAENLMLCIDYVGMGTPREHTFLCSSFLNYTASLHCEVQVPLSVEPEATHLPSSELPM